MKYILLKCHKCGNRTNKIYSYNRGTIRDLNIFEAKPFASVNCRAVKCQRCGNVVDDLAFIKPYKRVTIRLANYILNLCRDMTIKEVARQVGLEWKTVKDIHKEYLVEKFSQEEGGLAGFLQWMRYLLKRGIIALQRLSTLRLAESYG